jgi:hypothetical protein
LGGLATEIAPHVTKRLQQVRQQHAVDTIIGVEIFVVLEPEPSGLRRIDQFPKFQRIRKKR